MKFLSKLFGKEKPEVKPVSDKIPSQKPEPKERKPVYLTQTVTFGMHRYRSADEDSSVFFVDEEHGIRKMIVDALGNIQNFPGIVREDFWVKHVAPNYMKPQVRFRSSFEAREMGWIFLWQVQPDGWYWADEDGFGEENDWEVVLYTFLDRNGNFTDPFRIYKLGDRGYAMDRFLGRHTHSQKQALEAIKDQENHTSFPDDLFPQLWGCRTEHISDNFYQLKDRKEALEYWENPILSEDLKALAQALLDSEKSLWQIMGRDSNRVKGSMTLFYKVTEEPVFKQVLDKYWSGELDSVTVRRLCEES